MGAESSSNKPAEDRTRLVLSVVAPLFNEQDTVSELVRRVVQACRSLGVSFEFVVVNDGSTEETLPRLVALSRDTPELRVIALLRNFGHMPALSAGLSAARGDGVVVMDGDLQDPPELVPKLVAEWRAGADVVYGLRSERKEPIVRRAATAVFYWLLGLVSETKIPKQVGTFGLMDRRVVDVLNAMPETNRYFAGLRAWVGGKQSFVPYVREQRGKGESRVGFRGLCRLGRTALISFSKVPLRYASFFSLLCGFILFTIGVVAMAIRLFSNLAIPGWATYTTMIGMMGFVQSVVLAIISEYVAVIFDEVKGRPLFLIREEFAHGERQVPDEDSKRRE
jgi:glycosyltransferase involved in cell wall biosynthesis